MAAPMSRPRSHMSWRAVALAAVITLVLGVAGGAVGQYVYGRVTGPPAADVPEYKIPANLCAAVSRAPLSYFGIEETKAKQTPGAIGGDQVIAEKGCTVDFGNVSSGTSESLDTQAATFRSQSAAHDAFIYDGGLIDAFHSKVVTTRVVGVGSEAKYQQESSKNAEDDADATCKLRRGRLVVRHGTLMVTVNIVQCRPGTPPREAAQRGAALQIAVDLLNTLRRT